MGADTIGTEGGPVINLDDLTDPVLTDVQRQILDYTESRPVEFDLDAMRAEAVAAAGVDDLDDDGGVTARLAAQVAAIGTAAGRKATTPTAPPRRPRPTSTPTPARA